MGLLAAIGLAILQGVTELFPISSLGHAVIVPAVLHMNVDLRSPEFLPFLVVMHFGTAVALLLYFWRDWLGFAMAVLAFRSRHGAGARRLLGLVCLATVPAVVIGFALEKLVRAAFSSPELAATFLIVNALLLFAGERLKTRGSRPLDELGWKEALGIGLAQCLAFIPGLSRSGAALVAGLAVGLTHEAAARFTFLLATPIIAGATVLEAPKVLHSGATLHTASIVAGIVAAVTAYISIAFLMRYFRKHEFDALDPFGYYCGAAGILTLGWLWLLH
jgi:undecaprenyl-diphosphatase